MVKSLALWAFIIILVIDVPPTLTILKFFVEFLSERLFPLRLSFTFLFKHFCGLAMVIYDLDFRAFLVKWNLSWSSSFSMRLFLFAGGDHHERPFFCMVYRVLLFISLVS